MTFGIEAATRLVLATILGGLIGMERGRHGRAAGLRTHILVCIGSALTTCVGIYTVGVLGFTADPLRAASQVISGIGFLGAGTILVRNRFQVTGLTTAAGLWTTATIGLAVGVGFYAAAIMVSVIVIVVNAIMPRMERNKSRQAQIHRIYVELNDASRVNDFLDAMHKDYADIHIHITPARSKMAGHIGIEIGLEGHEGICLERNCNNLKTGTYVTFVIPDD